MRHLLSTHDLSRGAAIQILDTAEEMAAVTEREVKKLPALRGRTVVNLFFEDSTRTRISFEAAAKRLKELVDGKSVRVVYEDADRYGRILGIVYVSDSDINLQMLREGCAWHYKYYDKTKSYSDAENEARAAKRGLWEAHNPINPYEWRKSKRSNRRRR